MLKKLLLAIAMTLASMSFAFADVDVNKADQAALDGIKGIGPAISKAILDERKKGGNFKDWADLEARVKGIGDKNSEKFSQAGLTVGGMAKSNTVKPAAQKKEPAAKNDTLTKTDAAKPAVKTDTSQPATKVDASKPAAKADTSKPATKADTSKSAAKEDASKPAAKADTSKSATKADAKHTAKSEKSKKNADNASDAKSNPAKP